MITGKIDSSFQTEQRDLFASGVVAEIGVNAYAVWSAIKYHADYSTGKPSGNEATRRACRSIEERSRQGCRRAGGKQHATSRQEGKRTRTDIRSAKRMSVRIGSRVICTIVMDYVPSKLRSQLEALEKELESPGKHPEAFANVEIIPGEGFVWDEGKKTLLGRLKASELPPPTKESGADHFSQIGAALLKRVTKK